MNETVFDTLRGMVRRIDNPYVFPGKEPASHRADLPKSWEGFLVKASVEDFRWHDLRHTFASRLVIAGVDVNTVSKPLGHHDIKMTQRYAHLSPDHLHQAVRVFDKIGTQ